MSHFTPHSNCHFPKSRVVFLSLYAISLLSHKVLAAPFDPSILLGYSSENIILDENTDPEHGWAATQTANPNLGESLNFVGVDKPQPIRGSEGGTEVGLYLRPFHCRSTSVQY